MYYHFSPSFRRVFLALLLLGGAARSGSAQSPGWYLGVQGGTSFGQGTFRSITEHETHLGAQGGLFGAYRFNRLFSLEAGIQYGGQSQYALDCCPYWLSESGERYFTPVLDEKGWSYSVLQTHTTWSKAALQANIDLLSLVTRPGARWSLNVAPQISAVTTRTLLTTPDTEKRFDRQWHLGLGGQASVGYQMTEKIGLALYGGITTLQGERFDNMPEHGHKSNLIWDTGFKLHFSFGASRKTLASESAEIARKAAEEAARLEQARIEAEKLERAKSEEARLAAETAAREKAERQAREQAEREAAAARERAFRTPIPTVYFANNRCSIEASYLPSLEQALAIMQQYPEFQLEIHAYCSRSGSKAYNEKLSEQRMEAIRGWFADHGIGLDRMGKVYCHGIDYNAPNAEMARRAELKFVE